jgi:hypothetical protein
MSNTKTLAAAALLGLFAGGVAAAPAMAFDGQSGATMQKSGIVKVDDVVKEKHACKGQNSCKGKGADGKNSCKGQGSCRTDGGTPPSNQ